jgi:hypothetical protein
VLDLTEKDLVTMGFEQHELTLQDLNQLSAASIK